MQYAKRNDQVDELVQGFPLFAKATSSDLQTMVDIITPALRDEFNRLCGTDILTRRDS